MTKFVPRNTMAWTKEEDEALKVAIGEHPDNPRLAGEVYLTLGGRPRTYRALANRLYILTGSQAGIGQKLMNLNDAGEAMAGVKFRKGSKLAVKAEREAKRQQRRATQGTFEAVRPVASAMPTVPTNGGTQLDERSIRWAVEGFTIGAMNSDQLVEFLNRSK
jgi:hypothetical protein